MCARFAADFAPPSSSSVARLRRLEGDGRGKDLHQAGGQRHVHLLRTGKRRPALLGHRQRDHGRESAQGRDGELGEHAGDRGDGGGTEGLVRPERQVQGARSSLEERRDAEKLVEDCERAKIFRGGLILRVLAIDLPLFRLN